jgi:hypothetical protein
VQLLEDQADAARGNAGVMQTPMLATVGDGTGILRPHAGEGLEQGGFAGARGAHHGHKPAARNRDIEVTDQHASAPFRVR